MVARFPLIVLAAGIAAFLMAPGLPGPESTSANVRLVEDASERSPLYDHTVNGVLGDESFVATFGRRPGPGDSEDLRIRTHLAFVEQLLRERSVDHLSDEQRTARTRNLDRLHDYWTTGVFPRNTVVPGHRNPVFVDEAGRICAVGYLFEQDMGREAAERINARHRTATVFEIDDPVLGKWLATSGLTLEEAAMIQPAYGPWGFGLYEFTTSGATVCGANENPSPTEDSAPDVSTSDMQRGSSLSCQDDTDDVFGSSGFGADYNSENAVFYEVTYTGEIEDLYYMSLVYTVWRSATGPSEGRIVVSTDGGTLFEEIHTFAIGETEATEFTFASFFMEPSDNVIVALEARGGEPTGTLYLDDINSFVAYTPVELTSFNATVNGDAATLQWVTSSETNNAGFEVQILPDSQDEYHALGFVEGHGTTTEVQNYSYTVPNLDPGTHAFRLKQIDFDGAFEYSDEIEVTVAVPGTHLLTNAYPNPFNPQARFSLSVAQTQSVNVSVYDALGRRVLNLFDGVMAAGSAHPFALDGRGLATGLLLIRATGETFSAIQAVTLVR